MNGTKPSGAQPRIVIVGAGFGGLFAAYNLARAPVEITLIDRSNHHVFQPLLYQVATAGLAPSDIAWPIRSILRRKRNVHVLLGSVTGVDTEARTVRVGRQHLPYDYLVIATGAQHTYFGNEQWSTFAPGLKNIDDATQIRHRILLAFEQAEAEPDEAARRRLLTFVIVGAGPTGVELAGSIAELAKKALVRDFRRIDPSSSRIVLVEAGSRVLSGFHESLSAYAARALARLGVEVMLGRPVTQCDAQGVVVGEEPVPAATVIWAAGVQASPAGRWLGLETDRSGRVRVAPDLSVAGRPNVFVIGDTAAVRDANGVDVPGIAPAAKQQGRYVAQLIRARIAGRPEPGPFRYRDAGMLATIGRRAAVIQYKRFRLKGWLAWWIWGFAHIYFLIGVRSALLVSIQWLWQYISYRPGARLITGPADPN